MNHIGGTMKGLSAKRIQVRLGDVWKSPNLHVLLTQEEEVVVARCLDFTVSAHGENEKEAIQSLGEAIKEYLLTAIEENAMDAVYDPAQNKYWRMFNEIEAKSTLGSLKRSINKSLNVLTFNSVKEIKPEIHYA
jgi:predicted RNase H-like HicB family nuclease